MASVYSAGSASVQIVPDFSNAQRKIGEWFAKQGDLKVKVDPDLDNLAMARIRTEVAAQRPEMKVGVDRTHLAKQMVQAVDFLTGTSMVGNALKKLFDVKPILITNLAGAGVAIGSVLGQGITNAIGGAAAMLPSLVSAAAIPIGTAVRGSQGVGDAFKALGGTTEADAKKLAAAMKNLAPAARDFVTQVHELAPAFKDLRLDVQQHLFDGLGDSVNHLGHTMLPMLQKALSGTADEIGGIGKNLLAALSSNGNISDFAATIGNVNVALHNIGLAVAPLWSVFQNLATVGSDFLPRLTKGFGELATRFANFIQQARDSGALKEFIQTSFDGLKQLWELVSNLGSVLKSIFTAALPSGQVLMSVLKIITGDLAEFFKTDTAQSSLTQFFEGLTTAIGNLTPGLTSLVSALVTSVLPAMAGLAQAVAPIVNSLLVQFADLLSTLGPLFYPALAGAISTALGALTPLIAVFIKLAQSVLPVVIDAIKRLAPLFSELAEGVGDALVRAIETLTPILPGLVRAIEAIAEALVPFVLQVVNLGVDFLPPLVAILGGLAKALEFISPILPVLVTGFVAMKVVGVLTAMFSTLTSKLFAAAVATDTLSTSTMGLARRGLSNALLGAAGGAERMGLAAGRAGAALGVLGVGIGVYMMAAQAAKQKTDDFAKSLLEGGKAAAVAQEKMANPSFWDKFTFNLTHWGNTQKVATAQTEEATRAAREQFRAMSPLDQATSKVAYWQNELNYRMKEFGDGSPEVEAAQRRFHYWTGQVAHEQQAQADATKTATDRLKEQADQQRAMVDAGLALEQAILGVHSAIEDYNRVMADGAATDDDRARASIGVRQAIMDAADAAQRKAEADYTGADAAEKTRLGNEAFLATLKEQAATLTGPAKVAMDQYIADVERTRGGTAQAQAALKDLNITVDSMPDGHTIVIDAPTADQMTRLQELGYTVKYLPNGKVAIDVDTQTARNELDAFVAEMSKKSINVTVRGNTVISVGGKGGGGGSIAGGAIGGIVKAMANGGINSLFMSGKVASVVKPNTWRVIGDRVTDDEAFIPINRDARSQAILASTADRMGFGLVENATGNMFTPPGLASAYNGPGRESLVAAERDAQARRAGLAGAVGSTPSVAGFINNGTVLTTDLDELSRKSRIGTQRAIAAAGL